MYKIVRTKQFVRSLKKLAHSGKFGKQADSKLEYAIDALARGEALPASYNDHQLTGDLQKSRECHIKGDLLLKYEYRNDVLVLVLIDIGTHSYLFD